MSVDIAWVNDYELTFVSIKLAMFEVTNRSIELSFAWWENARQLLIRSCTVDFDSWNEVVDVSEIVQHLSLEDLLFSLLGKNGLVGVAHDSAQSNSDSGQSCKSRTRCLLFRICLLSSFHRDLVTSVHRSARFDRHTNDES